MKRLFPFIFVIFTALAARSEKPVVQLLICGEGAEIYELEGHAALRINHPRYGDMAVNWGVFDFDSPNFLWRFVKGETDYIAAAYDTRLFVDSYIMQKRSVRYLTLNLDSLQTERLVWLAMNNVRPENREYRYNYVLDNCSTRPLDMIAAAAGDSIILDTSPTAGREEFSTFRKAMTHYHRNYPWYQFGIDTALGSGIDRELKPDEPRFAPLAAYDMALRARFASSGEPLVTDSGYIWGSTDMSSPSAGPTPWALTPLFWGWTVFFLGLCVTILQMRGMPKWPRVFDTVWFGICGVEGLVLTFLIFVSVHEATSPNWLYLWLNPLCFIGAIAPWLKHGRRLEISYQSVNFALLIALVAVFIAGVQSPNPAFWPLLGASMLRAISNVYKCIKTQK